MLLAFYKASLAHAQQLNLHYERLNRYLLQVIGSLVQRVNYGEYWPHSSYQLKSEKKVFEDEKN